MSKEIMLRKIGNSQGIILPKPLVSKYNLDRVMIEDTVDRAPGAPFVEVQSLPDGVLSYPASADDVC